MEKISMMKTFKMLLSTATIALTLGSVQARATESQNLGNTAPTFTQIQTLKGTIGIDADGLSDSYGQVIHFAKSDGWHDIPTQLWVDAFLGLPVDNTFTTQ